MLIQTSGMNQDSREGIRSSTNVCFSVLSLISGFLRHAERPHLLPAHTPRVLLLPPLNFPFIRCLCTWLFSVLGFPPRKSHPSLHLDLGLLYLCNKSSIIPKGCCHEFCHMNLTLGGSLCQDRVAVIQRNTSST